MMPPRSRKPSTSEPPIVQRAASAAQRLPRTVPLLTREEQLAHLMCHESALSSFQATSFAAPHVGHATAWLGVCHWNTSNGVSVSISQVSRAAGVSSARPSGNRK